MEGVMSNGGLSCLGTIVMLEVSFLGTVGLSLVSFLGTTGFRLGLGGNSHRKRTSHRKRAGIEHSDVILRSCNVHGLPHK